MATTTIHAVAFVAIAGLATSCGGGETHTTSPAATTTATPPPATATTPPPPAPTAVATATSAPSTDLAVDLPLETGVDGQPDLSTRKSPKIAVWHEVGKGFYLAATTAGQRRHFKGKIAIAGGGTLTKLEQWVDPKEAAADTNWLKQSIKVSDDGKEVTFDLVSESKGLSGVSFDVKGDGKLTWELAIGGARDKDPIVYAPNDVVIGANGHHPESVPFKTWAHPDAKGKGK